jgi:hypothetical protein
VLKALSSSAVDVRVAVLLMPRRTVYIPVCPSIIADSLVVSRWVRRSSEGIMSADSQDDQVNLLSLGRGPVSNMAA